MLAITTLLLLGHCEPEGAGWARRFIGEANAKVLESATSAELYRIGPEGKTGPRSIDSYAIMSQRPVDLSVVHEVTRIVLADESLEPGRLCKNGHGYGSIKLCGGFHPNVIFRVHSGARWVELLMCFGCGDLGVISPRDSLRIRDDSGGNDRLLQLTAPLVPEDPWITRIAKLRRLDAEDARRAGQLTSRFGTSDRDEIVRAYAAQKGDVARLAFDELADGEWRERPSWADGVLLSVLKGLTPEYVADTGERCLMDERCRRGSARAFEELALFDRLSEEDYDRLLPKVAEVTLAEAEPSLRDFVLCQLALRRSPETTRVLWRVFDGEIKTNLPAQRALALVALSAQRVEEGRLALEQFVPATAAEASVIRFAWALVGRVELLEKGELASASTSLALSGVTAIRRFHRKDLLDLLVEDALRNSNQVVRDAAVTGIRELGGPEAPADVPAIREWWKSTKPRK